MPLLPNGDWVLQDSDQHLNRVIPLSGVGSQQRSSFAIASDVRIGTDNSIPIANTTRLRAYDVDLEQDLKLVSASLTADGTGFLSSILLTFSNEKGVAAMAAFVNSTGGIDDSSLYGQPLIGNTGYNDCVTVIIPFASFVSDGVQLLITGMVQDVRVTILHTPGSRANPDNNQST
jgi:hypothetical protein